jgi:hypothetical protein
MIATANDWQQLIGANWWPPQESGFALTPNLSPVRRARGTACVGLGGSLHFEPATVPY